MHGMLSAAVILVVFAVIALAGAGSAVWLYRAAATSAWRPQPAPGELPAESAVATGATAPATADLAAVPDPGWPWPPAAPGSGRPASQETTPDDHEEFGVVWEAPVGTTADRPGPPAAPEQVYDLAEWPDLDDAGDGPGDSGSRGPRAWPDLARSLYSRGWPAMDSPPSAESGWPRSGPRPYAEPDGPGAEGPGAEGPGSEGPGSEGPGSDGPGAEGPGAESPAPDGLAPNGLNPNSPEPAGHGSDGPDSDGPDSDGAEGPRDEGDGPPPGPSRGSAQVYVLGEPHQPRP